MTASRIFLSWLDTRLAATLSVPGLQRRRSRLWRALQPALARTPATAALAGCRLEDHEIVTPALLRRDYGRWNSLGLGADAMHEAAGRAETGGSGEIAPSIVAGYSTGTGGTRGIFLASSRERALYLGQSIARLLPATAMMGGARIVLVLRANSRLYSDVGRKGRFDFAYFPHDTPVAAIREGLVSFGPDVLIAPSHVLAGLARLGCRLPSLKRCFYGSEPMGGQERQWIAARLGPRPDPIYQATEGFIAAACRFGRLHLNDDSLEVELQPVAGTAGFQPVVTDLRRTSQPIVRVLLDDFIERDPQPCGCGFAGRIIRPVAGRVGDLWRLGGRVVTPREVVFAVETVLGPGREWKAIGSAAGIRLQVLDTGPLPLQAPDALQAALGLSVPLEIARGTADRTQAKRHRVSWMDAHG